MIWDKTSWTYWVTQILPQIYTENHTAFPIRIRKITVQICVIFWVTQYSKSNGQKLTKMLLHRVGNPVVLQAAAALAVGSAATGNKNKIINKINIKIFHINNPSLCPSN